MHPDEEVLGRFKQSFQLAETVFFVRWDSARLMSTETCWNFKRLWQTSIEFGNPSFS